MNLTKNHHIKIYIVIFFIISGLSALAYFYLPRDTGTQIKSSFIELTGFGTNKIDISPVEHQPEEVPLITTQADSISSKRKRLTQILFRSKKEMQILENERKSSSDGLDAAAEAKIVQLKEKIENIEKMIVSLK